MTMTQTSAQAPPRDRAWRAVMLLTVTPVMRWLVARFSVPVGRPPRSRCDRCGASLRPAGPGGSVLLPLGRCGWCRTKVGAPAVVLEAVTVLAGTVAVLAAPSPAVLLAVGWWLACVVPLVFIDLRVHRLPNVLTGAALAGVLVLLGVAAVTGGQWASLRRAALCAAVYGVLFLLVALVLGARGLGLGDVKLVVSVAALLGWWSWAAVFGAVFLAFLAAGAAGTALLLSRRVGRGAHIAMGPFLIAGTVAMLALLAWGGQA